MKVFLLLRAGAQKKRRQKCWRVKRGYTKSDVEWDDRRIVSTRGHFVSFEAAATVFVDPLEITIDDPAHAISEHRFISIGRSFRGRLLDQNHYARKPTRPKRRTFEEG